MERAPNAINGQRSKRARSDRELVRSRSPRSGRHEHRVIQTRLSGSARRRRGDAVRRVRPSDRTCRARRSSRGGGSTRTWGRRIVELCGDLQRGGQRPSHAHGARLRTQSYRRRRSRPWRAWDRSNPPEPPATTAGQSAASYLSRNSRAVYQGAYLKAKRISSAKLASLATPSGVFHLNANRARTIR